MRLSDYDNVQQVGQQGFDTYKKPSYLVYLGALNKDEIILR